MKNTFVISCPIDTYSGYGARARDFVKSLVELNKYDVKVLSQRWGNTSRGFIDNNKEQWGFLNELIIPGLQEKPDYWCMVTVPNEFQPVGKYNIGLTAGIETTGCDIEWIKGCNKMDLILTSSEHSKSSFLNSHYQNSSNKDDIIKLEKPIEVLFEGGNLDVYKTIKKFENKELYNQLDSIPEDFAYINVGHWMQGDFGHDRKNIALTIKSFYETFKNKENPPALILKTCRVNSSIGDKEVIQRKISDIRDSIDGKNIPSVYLLHGEFTDVEMNEIYNHPKIKAMISFTKGEGFGRPLLEFSLLNKPIIASGWSGHLDFLEKDCVALCGGKINPIDRSAQVKGMLIEGSQWFDIDHNYINHFLNEIFNNYDEWVEKAKNQSKHSKKNFSFDKMTKKIKELLIKNAPELPKKMELKLPGMDKIKMPKKDNKLKIVK
jgi:glycosyltransferase involved in cell wall biosynthesis|tara:strand:- start:2752 stop:4056 length:1305 start_codon:yes stop_codon:yes gene_type:complete